VLGLAGAVLGISFALYQRDLKRVLAYSSVENVGIVLVGLGTGLWGATSDRPYVAVLGTIGALLHVWNHGLMKSLLFLSAGSIVHATGSKDLERLGGLMKTMPLTSRAMTVGLVAISAVPPLNGFTSEWLVYLGLARGTIRSAGAPSVGASLAIAAIAFAGALTVLCFVRLAGVALLGSSRSENARRAHESPRVMTTVLVVLASLCVGAAMVPHLVAQGCTSAVKQIVGDLDDASTPLATMGAMNLLLLVLLVAGGFGARLLRGTRHARSEETWGCGYAAPTTRMQYTARSFSEIIAIRLMPAWLRPRVSIAAPAGLFPSSGSLDSDSSDPLTRGVYEPFLSRWADRFTRLRWLQQGVLHAYIFYILVTAVGLIAWISIRSWMGE
jgi:NADH:ubiquinone oxidoreductase subunit 5 (subunit L)/multisubunit Na+/H+ antiporter MnhA subunit